MSLLTRQDLLLEEAKKQEAKREDRAKVSVRLMRRIEAARVFCGLSIRDLSFVAGISHTTYYNRLRRPEELRIGELQTFADILKLKESKDFMSEFERLF